MNRVSYGSGLYFPLWALVLPITSVLVLPGLQGTTPGNLFALLLLTPGVVAIAIGFDGARHFYRDIAMLAMIFVSLNALAQLSLATLDFPGFGAVQLVDPFDRSVLMRTTMFTQSTYLLAAAITFVFVRHGYRPSWDKWFMAGAVLLACYGLYEVVWYAVTKTNGDFLTNRRFGDGTFSGSLFQTMAIGPIVTQRLKSLTGEPSMYAFTILPFWIYAIHTKRKYVHLLLLTTLLLSLSTTAFAGILLYCIFRLVFLRGKDKFMVLLLGGLVVGLLVMLALGFQGNPVVLQLFDRLVMEKLSGHGESGYGRLAGLLSALSLFGNLPWPNQLFGIGFGYIRSTDLFSTLLVNTGVIGLSIFIFMFIRPVFRLGNSYYEIGLKAALCVLTTTAMISVPEYSYLSTWLFLGVAYYVLENFERSRSSNEDAASEQFVQGATA